MSFSSRTSSPGTHLKLLSCLSFCQSSTVPQSLWPGHFQRMLVIYFIDYISEFVWWRSWMFCCPRMSSQEVHNAAGAVSFDHLLKVLLIGFCPHEVTISSFIYSKCLERNIWNCANILFLIIISSMNFASNQSCLQQHYCGICQLISFYFHDSFHIY